MLEHPSYTFKFSTLYLYQNNSFLRISLDSLMWTEMYLNFELTLIWLSRYFALCAPFTKIKMNLKTRHFIIPVLMFAPLYNIPRFFEFTVIQEQKFTCIDYFEPEFDKDMLSCSSAFVYSEKETANYPCDSWYEENFVKMEPWIRNKIYITISFFQP